MILDSDIVVVSLHGNTSGPCQIIRAGLLDPRSGFQARPGKNVPIFVGYFEDEKKHKDGHFQSIMPFRDSEILDMVKSDGGVDVAQRLNLQRPPVMDRLWPHCSPSQLARMSPSQLRLLLLPSVPCPRRSASVPDIARKPSQKRAKKRSWQQLPLKIWTGYGNFCFWVFLY